MEKEAICGIQTSIQEKRDDEPFCFCTLLSIKHNSMENTRIL